MRNHFKICFYKMQKHIFVNLIIFWTNTEPIQTGPNRSNIWTGLDRFGPVWTGLDRFGFQKNAHLTDDFSSKKCRNFFWDFFFWSNIFSTRLSITFFSDLINFFYIKKLSGLPSGHTPLRLF